MTLKLVKEIIIILLMTLATILLLTVVLADFIPSNTYIPQAVSYVPSEEVQQELQKVIEDKENSKVILTREITESDLKTYQRNSEYTPGKVNPFSSGSTEGSTENTSGNGTTTGSGTTTNTTTTGNTSNNSNSGGTNTTNTNTTTTVTK